MSEEPLPTEFIAPELEELNQLIPAYEFVSFIAKGGMGAVYLARQNSLDRLVAIKVLPPVLCQNEEFKASFETEAKLMAKLNHPNLIGIYDFGNINGMLYIVMEYVKGQSLFHSSYGKMIEQGTAVEIVSGVCAGLEHAHEAGMLHRDVKPANILLNKKAVPKIGDFGLARPSEMTETGMILGTPDYSAPEVLGAPERVDNRTDIFAVGVILYELMTGQLPGNPYVSVAQFADTDPRFDAIIQKAMHPDIDQRYASTMDLVAALDGVIKSPRSTNRLLVTGTNNATQVAPHAATMAPLTPSMGKKSSSGKTAMIWLGLLGLVLAGAFFVVQQSRSKEKKKLAAEKERQEETDRQAAELEKRKKARLESEAKLAKEKVEREKVKDDAVVLSPLQKLEAIKDKLVSGERPMEEMPETIFKRSNGSRILMFVETRMTWEEAAIWSEERGGYIAICNKRSDVSVFSKRMQGESTAWIGGGTTNKKWAWMEGSPVSSSISLPLAEEAEFLIVSSDGTLDSSIHDDKLPFFIEWRVDGSNPGSLEARLTRAKSSINSENPTYPLGTVTFGERKYCLLNRLMSREKALETAAAVDGRLVAISDNDELETVNEFLFQNTATGDKYWTAAQKENEIWSWETGENWIELDWDDNEGEYAVIESSAKPKFQSVSEKGAQYNLLIEWSEDVRNVASSPLLDEIAILKEKAKGLVEQQQKDIEKNHVANISKLMLNLSALNRRLEEKGSSTEASIVSKVIKDIEEKSRVPDNVSDSLNLTQFREHTEYALQSQVRIRTKDRESMMKIRDAYVNRLSKLSKEMTDQGRDSVAEQINREIQNVGEDNKDFEQYVK